MDQKDSAVTPIITSLGLPSGDPEPQIPQPPPVDPVTTPEIDPVPVTPNTQLPSISIATLSDFTIVDTSNDESPADPTVIIPHDMFYLEDRNVEVLCRNTLFRVHTSILSLHSCALSNVRSDQPGDSRVTQQQSLHPILGHSHGFRHTPENDISPRVRCSTHNPSSCLAERQSTDFLRRARCLTLLFFHPSSGLQ